MASEKAKEYTDTVMPKTIKYADNVSYEYTEEQLQEAFDAGVESVITKLKDEFINKPKDDILERALDDYFSGCTHFCSNDEDIERLFSHVIDYFIRKC